MSKGKEKIAKYFSNIKFEKYVGISGLAVLSAASLLAFLPPTSPSAISLLATYLSSLGLNVLSGVLQNSYQNLITSDTQNDAKLKSLAKKIEKDIKKDARLRIEIGEYLDNFESFRIAEEIVRGNPAVHGWLLLSLRQDIGKYGAKFDKFIENSERRHQELLDAVNKKGSKSTTQNTKKTTITPVSPYSLLPFEKQEEKLIQDLKKIVTEKNGNIFTNPIFPYQLYQIVLPIRSEKYVLQLIVSSKCTKGDIWRHIHRTWAYEHGILFVVMGSVSSQAFPPIYPTAIPQHSPTDWGWFTIFNYQTARFFSPTLKFLAPENTTEMSFFNFTLSQIKDENILRKKFDQLLEFLETDDDNYTRIKKARDSININLERWLNEGWLVPKDNIHYLGKLDKPPKRLLKNERFIRNRYYKFEHDKLIDKLSQYLLDLQE